MEKRVQNCHSREGGNPYLVKKFFQVILIVAIAALLPACTVLRWGGPKNSPSPAPEPTAEDIFKSGEDLLSKGKYDEARKKYESVKERDLDKTYDALVEIRLGDSYYEEARYSEAEVEYRHFLELHQQNKAAPYVMYQIGMCNFKQIDRPDRDPSFAINAESSFGKLLKDYPNNPYEEESKEKLKVAREHVPENEYLIGQYYYKRGSWKAAEKRFQGLVEKFPGSKDEPETLYCLADSCINLKDYDSAKNALARLYQEYPNNRFAEKAKSKLASRIPEK